MDINIYKAKKKCKNYVMLEDSICINQILPFFHQMKNIGRINKTTNIYKFSNEATNQSIGWHIKQKSLGKVKGISDYIITWQHNGYNVFGWLEVKQPKGKQTKSQKDFESSAKERNEPYEIVTCIEEFEKILKKWDLLK